MVVVYHYSYDQLCSSYRFLIVKESITLPIWGYVVAIHG
jgi:hypothetical protein